jgi:hypothetical protein
MPSVAVVYLAYIARHGQERVVVRGVFRDHSEAASLKPLDGEIARNLVECFDDVDMGFHVGFTVRQ